MQALRHISSGAGARGRAEYIPLGEALAKTLELVPRWAASAPAERAGAGRGANNAAPIPVHMQASMAECLLLFDALFSTNLLV